MEVAAWLRSLGLEQYVEAFRENAVDAGLLPRLTADDLKDLGVTLVGHRRRMLEAIAELPNGSREAFDGSSTSAAALASPPAEAPEGERRQVTVLFVDLVGSTTLTRSLGSEAMHALLAAFFTRIDGLVEQYGGSVDKHIGDCVMGMFGAPTAYGNDTERALRAALAIRDAMPALSQETGQRLAVHMGVASGTVVASSMGSGRTSVYTVTGESVNLASRLADSAGAGEILVSDGVQRGLDRRLDCTEVGDLHVDGFRPRLGGRRPRLGARRHRSRDSAAVGRCGSHRSPCRLAGAAGCSRQVSAEDRRPADRRCQDA